MTDNKHIDIGHRQACVSAGFYRITNGKVDVFGKSTTLNLGTREIDATYIARLV